MRIVLLALVLGCLGARAEERAMAFEPCSSWRYQFETNTYACSWTNPRTYFYTASEVDSLVRQLENRIASLEARVKALEGQE